MEQTVFIFHEDKDALEVQRSCVLLCLRNCCVSLLFMEKIISNSKSLQFLPPYVSRK